MSVSLYGGAGDDEFDELSGDESQPAHNILWDGGSGNDQMHLQEGSGWHDVVAGSVGAFAHNEQPAAGPVNLPVGSKSYPNKPAETPGHDPQYALGLFGAAGLHVDISNARSPGDLAGPFTQYSLTVPGLNTGVQLNVGKNGVYNVAIGTPPVPGVGVGLGAISAYDTTTSIIFSQLSGGLIQTAGGD